VLLSRVIPTLLAVAAAACVSMPRQAVGIEAEAREFMAGYARDLRAGARDAIAARYDARGAYMIGRGAKALLSPDSIRARYHRPTWTAPARFDWCDLSYEVVAPDAVLVTGRFEWTTGAGQTIPASYTSLLVRREGGLRIRAEHEDFGPPRTPAEACGR
jgi:hypothetical protein